MAIRFTLVSEEYVNPTDYPIGITKDATLVETSPTNNYGDGFTVSGQMNVGVSSAGGAGGGRNYWHCVLEIQMPNKDDAIGFEEVHDVEIRMKIAVNNIDAGKYVVIGITEIPDDFDEGAEVGAAGWCCWNQYIDAVTWSRGAGAVPSRNAVDDEDRPVFDTFRMSSTTSGWVTLNLKEALDFGDLKRFVMFVADSDISSAALASDVGTCRMYCQEDTTPANRPILDVTFRDYPPEAFTDKDSALSIEPNPNNPEQPLLKWGGVKDADFVDFKVYRETTAITTVAALTPIATITSPADQEYIDTYAHVDGTTYYYLVIAEDGNNTGDDATFSNQIAWTKPAMATYTVNPTGSCSPGATKRVVVTSTLLIKRIYVAWGDGSTSWYEYETAATSQYADHIFTKVLTTFAPDVRMEDVDGFWSDLLDTTTTMSVTDSDPTAKLRVSVKKGQLGDYVTLDASLSQPLGSNITITKYEFKRDAADAYQDNGTNPIYTFKTGTAGGEYPTTIGVKTATLRITTSSSLTDTDTATYELETGTATELEFSAGTKIHEWNHDLPQDKLVEVPIGSAGVAHEFLISRPPERLTLVGTSNHPNVGADIALIRAAWLANTFVKFVITSEMEGKTVTYEGKIDGDITLGQAYQYKQSWTFPLRIITRTEA